jgi:hypothetical protein
MMQDHTFTPNNFRSSKSREEFTNWIINFSSGKYGVPEDHITDISNQLTISQKFSATVLYLHEGNPMIDPNIEGMEHIMCLNLQA